MITKLKTLTQNQNIMRYAKNSAWMLAEYALKIISAIFVTIYVARYLGPEQFGLLSYALAIVAIFMAVSRLGMESILVRDIAKYPDQSQAYMSTAFGLMVIAAIAGLVVVSTLIYFIETDPKTQLYIWIIATGILFQTLLVIDYNFQAQVKAKFSSIAKSIALGLSSVIKIYLVWIQADLMHFAIAYAIDHAIIGTMLIIMHLHKKQINFLKGFNSSLIKPLLKSAWPMIVSSLSIILFMKTDQLMIQWFLGNYELGLYSAASKISEAWMFLMYALGLSLTPFLLNKKAVGTEEYKNIQMSIFSGFIWSTTVVALLIFFLGERVLHYSFGVEFLYANASLVILFFANIFASIGTISNRIMTIELLESKIAKRYMVAFFLNIILNIILIPILGIDGAALASLFSVFFANYVAVYIDKDTRYIFFLINKSLIMKK